MTYKCPRCGADRISTKGYARRLMCAVGAIAGAVGGATGAIGGAEVGAAAGLVAGPPGAIAGGLAGAIVGALVCSATACSAGAALGELIDENILDNFVCQSCHFSFGKTSAAVAGRTKEKRRHLDGVGRLCTIQWWRRRLPNSSNTDCN